MTRLPRQLSDSGYLHLIIRGVNKQVLFEEDDDYRYYIHLLKKTSIEENVKICAYCLMENHIHILAYDVNHATPRFMKKMNGTYALFFNNKYERTGHLYQGRYLSKAIDSEDTLLTVFRYILTNPEKANVCPAAEYPWSSYRDYGNPNAFVDTMVLSELLGSYQEYEAFISAKYKDDETVFFDYKRDDEWARSVIRKYLNVERGTEIQAYDKKSRNEAIQLLREKGLTIRQIERLTGISKGIIQKI